MQIRVTVLNEAYVLIWFAGAVPQSILRHRFPILDNKFLDPFIRYLNVLELDILNVQSCSMR